MVPSRSRAMLREQRTQHCPEDGTRDAAKRSFLEDFQRCLLLFLSERKGDIDLHVVTRCPR